MFRLNAKNIEAFRAHDAAQFEARLVRRLRDNFAHLGEASDADLVDLVRGALERAARYGICSRYGCSLFVGLTAELGENFDANDSYLWIAKLLDHPFLPEDEKLNEVCKRVLMLDPARKN